MMSYGSGSRAASVRSGSRPFGAPNGTPRYTPDSAMRGTATQYEHQLQVLAREVQRNPSFQDSVALQTRWRSGLPSINMEQRMDRRSELMRLKESSWREVNDFCYYYRRHFEADCARFTDNYDFYYGFQWDDRELKAWQKIRLVAHVSNYMSRWIRTLLGEKRGTETQFNFESEDDSLKPITELYNQVVGKIARANRWSKKSNDFFANLSVGGRGFASVRPDPFDPFRKIQIRNERPQEFMYDFENAQDGTLEGCNYMMRSYYRDLEEVIFQYPEWEEYLLNYDYAASSGIEQLMLFTIAKPKIPPTAYKRVVETPQAFEQRPFFQRRRLAWITEFYRLEGIKQWTVRDGNFNIDYDFDAFDGAVRFYQHLRDASLARNVAMTGEAGLDLVAPPMHITRRVLNTEIWCSNVLLDAFTRRIGRFPYVAQHNEFHDGQWRGHFEDDKPNQKMRNLVQTLLAMQIGNLKGKTWYHEKLFSPESTEKQRQEIVRDPMRAEIGHWNTDIDPKHLSHTVFPSQMDGQTLRYLTELVEKASEFGNGGLSMVGGAEFAGQSAKSSRTLAQNAQTGIENLVADMKDAEDQVGQILAYQAQFLHPTVLLEYANAEDRQRFLPLLQTMSHSIEMDQITMNTSEVVSGPTRANQQAADLLEVAGQDPEMLTDVMPEVMRLRRFPQTMVDRVEQRRTERGQAASDEAQREQRMAEADLTSKIRDRDAKIDLESERIDILRNPPIGMSFTGKVNAPGPDAMAEVFKQHRIDADPGKMIQSEQMQDAKDQQRDNARQKDFQEIDLPYQRKLAGMYPKTSTGGKSGGKPKKSTEGVRSAKDRNNRSRKKAERTKTQV